MKKYMIIVLGCLLAMGLTSGACFAAAATVQEIPSVKITVDGREHKLKQGQKSIIFYSKRADGSIIDEESDLVYVPARYIAEALDKEVVWDGQGLIFKDKVGTESADSTSITGEPDPTQWDIMERVELRYKYETVIFDKSWAVSPSNEKSYMMDFPALNANGRIYLPLEVVSNFMDKNYKWVAEDKLVEIGYKPYGEGDAKEGWKMLKHESYELLYPATAILSEDQKVIRFEDDSQSWCEVFLSLDHLYSNDYFALYSKPFDTMGDVQSDFEKHYNYKSEKLSKAEYFSKRYNNMLGYWDMNHPGRRIITEVDCRGNHHQRLFCFYNGDSKAFEKHREEFYQIMDSVHIE